MGPRFGGAVDDVARYFLPSKMNIYILRCFYHAVESGLPPEGFIDKMRHDGALIPGIGHRIKSILSPDKRVSILKKFALENFPIHNYLNYALEVCFHFYSNLS